MDPRRHLTELVISANAEDAPPTPPYRQYPPSVTSDIQSPPYKSRSQVQLMEENEKQASNEEIAKSKPSVHYPDSVPQKPSGFVPTHSRMPSVPPSDDDNDEDEYDWSTEDDLVDEEAKKYEQQIGGNKERGCFVKVLAFFLSTLVGSVITSGVIVAAALLVHFFYYEPSSGDTRNHRKFVTSNVEAWLFWASANLLVSWFLAFLIDIVPGLVTWVIFVVWGHISESMKSRVELYNSLKGTIKPPFYTAAAWVSWVIIFAHIYKLYDIDDEAESWASYTPRLYQVIEFAFFLVLVLSAQKMLSHVIAFAFHRTAFKDRLQDLNKALKTIDHLKNYKPKRDKERNQKFFGGLPLGNIGNIANIGNIGHNIGHIGRGHFGFNSDTPTPYNEKSHFITGASRTGTPEPYEDGSAGDCEDNSTTSKKGKGKQKRIRIRPVSAATTPSTSRPVTPVATQPTKINTDIDLSHIYPPKSSSPNVSSSGSPRPETPRVGRRGSDSDDGAVLQAAKALKTAVLHDARNIKGSDDADISGLGWAVGSTDEAKRLARSIYYAFKGDRRRHYLIAEDLYPAYATENEAIEAFRVFDVDNNGDVSRNEIKQTLVKTYRERRFLSRSMRDVGQALRSLDKVLLLFAFVIVFFISLSVFGVDVGDSLTSVYTLGIAASFIFKQTCANMFDAIMFLFVTHPYDTGDRCFIDNENLVVKRMNLFATVFIRSDGTETYYFNSQLFSKFITNARRSDKTAELCTLYIDWKTPLEKIDALENCLNDWLSVEKNRWYEPSTGITLQSIDYQRCLEITIGIPHNSNWQDWGLRNTRKTAFYAAATYYCKQLSINYSLSPMPIIWSDPNTGKAPIPSPTSAVFDDDAPNDNDEKSEMIEMKPMLGFQPPPGKRNNALLRARKSKGGKKAAFKGMDG